MNTFEEYRDLLIATANQITDNIDEIDLEDSSLVSSRLDELNKSIDLVAQLFDKLPALKRDLRAFKHNTKMTHQNLLANAE